MHILNVTCESQEAGIPFADLDSVKEALRVFMDGGTAAAFETTRLSFDSTPIGGYTVATKLMMDNGREDSFLDRLFLKMDRANFDKWGFFVDFEHDGVGPFLKTSVEVKKFRLATDASIYSLLLNAAYVGDKKTSGLAEALGIKRALWQDRVDVTTEPTDNNRAFEFDFGLVAERLTTVGIDGVRGRQVADHMMEQAKISSIFDREPYFRVWQDELVVTVGINTLGVGEPTDWRQQGSVITGPVGRWCDDITKPEIYISVATPQDDSESSLTKVPVFEPSIKDAIHEMAQAIVEVFQQ